MIIKRSIIATLSLATIAAVIVILSFCLPALASIPLEHNIDRTGSDYRSFDLPAADPNLCCAACEAEAECKAFTYVKPGVQGSSARCWLKNSVPGATPADCCVSGVKPESSDHSCYTSLPDPQLALVGMESYTASGGQFTRYKLAVVNRAAYPAELFQAAPDLPPCGSNTNSARAWVNIYDQNHDYIYGFCSLGSPADLGDLWFAVPQGDEAPTKVYIVIEDRRCGITYVSNQVSIATPASPPGGLPEPMVDLTGVWNCDDGGQYYLRQLGGSLWWYGELDPLSPNWSNVMYGTISGHTINGNWADVPKGGVMQNGVMELRIESANRLVATHKTGGFAGSVWTR
jgi:hypothetical protein